MRLDKLLEKHGYGSRGAIKKLVKSKQVTVDGMVVLDETVNVSTMMQVVCVTGVRVKDEDEVYFMMHKPSGVVSAVRDQKEQTVIELLKPEDKKDGLYPVGRLDKDTTGLLLLTNNGPLGFKMLHPQYHVEKVYAVTVNGFLTQDAVDAFLAGVVFLDGTRCQSAKLIIDEATDTYSYARVHIREGKFHQIKKMFLSVGVKVIQLKRVSFAQLQLDETLHEGMYRHLTDEECALLRTYLG